MSLIEKNPQAAPSFEEQLRQAEAEAGVGTGYEPEPDVAVSVQEPPVAEVEAEVVAEAEPVNEASEPEPEVDKTAEELAALNKKLGQLINENAELRQRLDTPVEQTPQQFYGDVSWFDEMADTNPGQAAVWALQNQQPHLYDRAVRVWYEQDPVAAGRYERQLEAAALQQTLEKQMSPQLEAAQKAANAQELSAALEAVASRHDDFADVMGALSEDGIQNLLASGLPKEFLEQGLMGDQASKEKVYETIYRWVKADVAGQLVQAARETPARQSEEAKQAKRDAFVGTASTTTPDEVPETEEQRLARVFTSGRPSLRDAWENRAPSRLGR